MKFSQLEYTRFDMQQVEKEFADLLNDFRSSASFEEQDEPSWKRNGVDSFSALRK
ncbi:hypothetical protein BRIN106911_01860 [Brevibacillus invocatus]